MEDKANSNETKPEKKAMSVLHEWCSYRGLSPKYEFQRAEGSDHCPKFFYCVTVGELTAEGDSTSKRAAKHAAAQALLDMVAQNTGENGIGGIEAMEQDKADNPASILQALCLKNGWPVPVFNKPQLLVTCKVGDHEVTGTGANKKIAKKEAATAMMKLLESATGQDYWKSGV